ncbi:hypothetical protein QBC35DRAFT_555229 [Podospora australis]|uniref:Uncharacterized protein n=1 Tax=Podospora australis TaxID=1536484 RepID=A0AAN7AHL6_9PEZI|nr:hypothetical protein QBC35DRAFT_555229 [Podospora australis]
MKLLLPILPLLAGTATAIPSLAPVPVPSIQARNIYQPRGTFHLSDILNPVIGFLECSQGDSTVQLLCKLVAAKLNAALAAANTRADRSGLLFSYSDSQDIKIDTGHSCTVTASITSSQANAKLLADASLQFSGNPLSLSNPGLFVADLPVELWAKSDIKQKFGTRVLGKCIGAGSDSFSASGSLSTRAHLAVLFTFAPAPLRRDSAGNYILTIRPITKVAAQVTDTNINFDIKGVSFLNGLVTAILGGTSSILKAITHIIKGDSLKAVWKDVLQHVVDVTAGVLLSTPFDLLDNLVELLAQSYIDEKKNGIAATYSGEMEKTLRAAVSKALKLDSKGERNFVLRADFVDLVARLGEGAPELWLAEKPAGFCASDAECNDGRWCNGVERCVNEVCVAGQAACERADDLVCNEAGRRCVMNCGPRGRLCPRDIEGVGIGEMKGY